jgi:alcohol dehydrogenase class IV
MPEVIVGVGATKELGEVAKAFGRRALIVAGRDSLKSGRIKAIEDELMRAGVDFIVYSDFDPEPTLGQAEKLAEYVSHILSREGVEFVIGFGGGSSLDMAKIASLASANPRPVEQYMGINKVPRKGLPLILVPTTAGSGSEASMSIVLARDGIKDGVVSEKVMADLAIVDPVLTITMPPDLTSMTGIDALSHAIEAYMSINSNAFTDPLALKAISMISANLRRAYSNGSDLNARKTMSEAALLAGLAFSNASNCAGHAAAYAFAAKYGVPHGIACGIALPYVMKFNTLAIPERLADVAIAMGVEGEGLGTRELAQLAIAEVIDLLTDLGLPTSLQEIGIPEEDVVGLAENMLKITRLLEANPRRVGPEEARKIFEAMWHGDIEAKI